MSQENVEVVRATFAAWNAGNMNALRDLHDPEVIVRPPKGWPEPGPFVGRATVRKHKIFSIEYFWDHAEALEATGLSE